MTDDHVEIGRQFGIFLRRADRFYASLRVSPDGLDLERGAYILLSRIASGGPARLSVLADDVCLDLSTVSRQVGALESAGLVDRSSDPTDKRAVLVAATATGQAVFARNRELWQSALRDLLADWTAQERAEFTRLFTRLNETIATSGQEKR
ncbi:MAG TPA: MarR family transcriptional regulator [Rugosimonospora sp.]|jgi:DNA-binding MarR family transcriptional regulator